MVPLLEGTSGPTGTTTPSCGYGTKRAAIINRLWLKMRSDPGRNQSSNQLSWP